MSKPILTDHGGNLNSLTITEIEIDRIEWCLLRESCGSAERIPVALLELLNASTPEAGTAAYWKLENHVVVQGQLFEAAVYVVPVLIASLLEERPKHVRIGVLELLFQILSGKAHHEELVLGNSDIAERCKIKAREGLWLLYRELKFGLTESAFEILELIELDSGRLTMFKK